MPRCGSPREPRLLVGASAGETRECDPVTRCGKAPRYKRFFDTWRTAESGVWSIIVIKRGKGILTGRRSGPEGVSHHVQREPQRRYLCAYSNGGRCRGIYSGSSCTSRSGGG